MPTNNGSVKPLGVTHVNIRQSISIVIAKMALIEFIFAIFILFSHYIFIKILGDQISDALINNQPYILGLLLFIKAILTFFVLLSWLNEYYEISADKISHISGVIFKKEQRFSLPNIRQIILKQGLVGRIFNYGTIEFFDYAVKKYYQIYQIHNPVRYFNLLKVLVPNYDEAEEITKRHLIDVDTTP